MDGGSDLQPAAGCAGQRGAEKLFDPDVNIAVGAAEFAQKLEAMQGRPVLAIAAYNGGDEAMYFWEFLLGGQVQNSPFSDLGKVPQGLNNMPQMNVNLTPDLFYTYASLVAGNTLPWQPSADDLADAADFVADTLPPEVAVQLAAPDGGISRMTPVRVAMMRWTSWLDSHHRGSVADKRRRAWEARRAGSWAALSTRPVYNQGRP